MMILRSLLVLLPALIGPADLTTRGKECRIKSDISPKIAKRIAERVDNYCVNFARFYDQLGLKPRSSNKVVIRLFGTREEFVEFFHRNHRGDDPPAAYFSPSLNGVVSYYDPDDPYLKQVLFHETSHQYMNRYADWSPKWTNEGLAQYFAGWRVDADGALLGKRPPFYDLLLLQKALRASSDKTDATKGRTTTALSGFKFGGHLKPEDLVTMEREAFNDFPQGYFGLHPFLHYATSWGLTWYFLEGPNEPDRELYLDYFRRMCKDGDRADPLVFDDWDAFEERWTAFILAIEIKPESADDHFILATELRREREYKEAVKHYELALDLAPGTPKVSYWTGYCFKLMGKYDDAIKHLEAAAESDEDDPAPLYYLARIVGRMDRAKENGDPERALEYAVEASDRVKDKDPHYLSFVARCQLLAGDARAAKKTMKRVLKLVKKSDKSVKDRYRKMLDEME